MGPLPGTGSIDSMLCFHVDGGQVLVSTKITGQIMFALDSRVSALGSNSLAGIFRHYWSNLCTRTHVDATAIHASLSALSELSEGSACSPIWLRLESGLTSGLPRMG